MDKRFIEFGYKASAETLHAAISDKERVSLTVRNELMANYGGVYLEFLIRYNVLSKKAWDLCPDLCDPRTSKVVIKENKTFPRLIWDGICFPAAGTIGVVENLIGYGFSPESYYPTSYCEDFGEAELDCYIDMLIPPPLDKCRDAFEELWVASELENNPETIRSNVTVVGRCPLEEDVEEIVGKKLMVEITQTGFSEILPEIDAESILADVLERKQVYDVGGPTRPGGPEVIDTTPLIVNNDSDVNYGLNIADVDGIITPEHYELKISPTGADIFFRNEKHTIQDAIPEDKDVNHALAWCAMIEPGYDKHFVGDIRYNIGQRDDQRYCARNGWIVESVRELYYCYNSKLICDAYLFHTIDRFKKREKPGSDELHHLLCSNLSNLKFKDWFGVFIDNFGLSKISSSASLTLCTQATLQAQIFTAEWIGDIERLEHYQDISSSVLGCSYQDTFCIEYCKELLTANYADKEYWLYLDSADFIGQLASVPHRKRAYCRTFVNMEGGFGGLKPKISLVPFHLLDPKKFVCIASKMRERASVCYIVKFPRCCHMAVFPMMKILDNLEIGYKIGGNFSTAPGDAIHLMVGYIGLFPDSGSEYIKCLKLFNLVDMYDVVDTRTEMFKDYRHILASVNVDEIRVLASAINNDLAEHAILAADGRSAIIFPEGYLAED